MSSPGNPRDTGEIAQGLAQSDASRTSPTKETAGAGDDDLPLYGHTARRGSAIKLPPREISMPHEGPPLPYEDPPLPEEAPPHDDGWTYEEDPSGHYIYVNRFTGVRQWQNPRVPETTYYNYASYARYPAQATGAATSVGAPGTSSPPKKKPLHGGYNPKIHGSYDPNADYAKTAEESEDEDVVVAAAVPASGLVDKQGDGYTNTAQFNRFNGKFQPAHVNPELHNDENKSARQLNAFYDHDAAVNKHQGRSLKEERRKKPLTKKQLEEFRDKQRKKKEQKRRAWLLD